MATPLEPAYPITEQKQLPQEQPNRQVHYDVTEFKEKPMTFVCNRCHKEGVTMTEYNTGNCTYLMTCVTCIILPIGCALVPYMMDSFKDVVHTCPNCANLIAVYER